MKRHFYLLILFLILGQVTFAMELTGGVQYDVNSARQYVQENQTDNIEITGPYQLQTNNTEKVVYSYNNSGDIVGITVQYKGDRNTAYIYNKNKDLIYIDKYDKPVNIYPHRGYRYDMNGKLNLTSLTVSKNELFRFSPDGKLLVHSINGVIYDENGKIIGTGK